MPVPSLPDGHKISLFIYPWVFFGPNPCPNRVFTRRVCGYRVPIAIPTAAASLAETHVPGVPSPKIQATVVEDEDDKFGDAALGGEESNTYYLWQIRMVVEWWRRRRRGGGRGSAAK